jgi:hypothetical protein
MKKRVTNFWLMPAQPECEFFKEVIRILAKELDAPLFAPHVTLCQTDGAESVGRLLSQVRAAPMRLRIREIAHSGKFTKTLFVRFAPTKSLEQLVTKVGGKAKTLSDPHLSLLYKKLPLSVRRELATTIKLPFREVTFDSIATMNCTSPTETRQDVKSWRRLATKRLSG